MKQKSELFPISGHKKSLISWFAHTKTSQTTQRKLHQQSMELIEREILKGINSA